MVVTRGRLTKRIPHTRGHDMKGSLSLHLIHALAWAASQQSDTSKNTKATLTCCPNALHSLWKQR